MLLFSTFCLCYFTRFFQLCAFINCFKTISLFLLIFLLLLLSDSSSYSFSSSFSSSSSIFSLALIFPKSKTTTSILRTIPLSKSSYFEGLSKCLWEILNALKTISERLRSIRNLIFDEIVLDHYSTTDSNRVKQGGRSWQSFGERKMATKNSGTSF